MSVLVAGIGNIFLGDDAFGIEVVRRLATRSMPDGVRIVDFGIRGFDLANALIDSADSTVLLVDATRAGVTRGRSTCSNHPLTTRHRPWNPRHGSGQCPAAGACTGRASTPRAGGGL